jgi:hypothetical protein
LKLNWSANNFDLVNALHVISNLSLSMPLFQWSTESEDDGSVALKVREYYPNTWAYKVLFDEKNQPNSVIVNFLKASTLAVLKFITEKSKFRRSQMDLEQLVNQIVDIDMKVYEFARDSGFEFGRSSKIYFEDLQDLVPLVCTNL